MQKLLNKKQQGFTLVELLVVIAIIAILAVIGLTVFTGLQKGARDAQRRADVEAISKALETNYNTNTAQYAPLAATMFANQVVPTDPLTGQSSCNGGAGSAVPCEYCITAAYNNAAIAAPAACATGSTVVATNTPPVQGSAGATGYLVCANLEVQGANNATFYCRGSQR